ncbi:MAG TPA: 16S rRNA (guanine(527)-N(7))-methyltransferase RsmG [Actinomycetota bacterium]
MKHEGWEVLDDLGVELDGIQIDLLESYEGLLIDTAIPRGMIARTDAPRLRERHLLDCLRAAPLIGPSPDTACDLGSGAGLPGIPLAIVRPDIRFTLVEVRRNRALFLERVVSELGLTNVSVHGRRLETYRATADLCFARAYADAKSAWAAASRLLTGDGRLIYWAGESFVIGTDAPPDALTELFPTSALARSGPLAIMSPQ